MFLAWGDEKCMQNSRQKSQEKRTFGTVEGSRITLRWI
jgi:hypothetical protein